MKILFVVKELDVEHLGIMTLSSMLKQTGHDVDIAAALIDKINQKIKGDEMQIVAFSTPTIFLKRYLSLARQIKKKHPHVITLFGGPHPTLEPGIIQDEGVDCVCRGEGEKAFVELAECLDTDKSYVDIKNLWVKKDNTIYRNELRPLIKNLDSIPPPDRYLFPNAETWTKGKMHVITSRGCPFRCSYCSHPAMSDLYGHEARYIRRRSVHSVVNEIKCVKSQGRIGYVMFEDDMFVSDKEWLRSFAKEYKRVIGVPFFCYVRASFIDKEIVCLLKEAGCHALSMGLETANDKVRNDILRRDMTRDEILKAAYLIKQAGIFLETMNIVGIPGSSLENDIETIRLNIDCQSDYSSVKLLMPYPHTAIRVFAQERGLLDERLPESFWKSSLIFKSEKEKRAVENLRKLFAITVEFRFLLPFIEKAIWWPLGWFYSIVHILWDGYAAYFRLYPTGWRGFLRGMRKYFSIQRFAA